MYKIWLIIAGLFLSLNGFASEEPELRPHPMRMTVRHIEPNGIGYNQGYTTLEGFISVSEPWGDDFYPFLDLRGHIFNNGYLAANAGLGLRFLSSSRVWGANAYYDYRDTRHQHYNQVAVGLETLGRIWDFRINGYLPVGDRTSPLYDIKYSRFQQNQILISQKYQFAMKGINGEVGIHADPCKNIPLYFAAGPYYLEGDGRGVWGGQVRAAIDFSRFVRIEGNGSYDKLFKWIGQGQVSLTFSFGPRKEVKKDSPSALTLATRAVQRVDRAEIIPIDTKDPETIAVDPATSLPYFVWFVNNTSHSDGTFASPFTTLTQAIDVSSPSDIIYVYSGDGTALQGGQTLLDSQQLLGASITHVLPTTLGNITLPISSPSLPLIDSTDSATLTLGNNNTIAGFQITNSGTGVAIKANAIDSFTAIGNTLSAQVTGGDNKAGFELDGACTGEFVFTGNTFTDADLGINVAGTLTGNLSSSSNAFDVNSVGIYVNSTTVTGNISSVSDMFNTGGSAGVYVYAGTISGDFSCTGSTFATSTGIELDNGSTLSGNLTLQSNVFNTGDGVTINGSPSNIVSGNFTSLGDTFNTTSIGINIPSGAVIGGIFSSTYGIFGANGIGLDVAGTVTSGAITNGRFSSNQGVEVIVPASTTATWAMTGNTFTVQNMGSSYPVTVTNIDSSASTSLSFNANSVSSSIYNLAKFTANSGTFDVTSESGNTGNISGP